MPCGGYPYRRLRRRLAAPPTAILVSRSLNFDDMNHVFNAKMGVADYSAQMATGAPDSSARSATSPTAWMPAPSRSRAALDRTRLFTAAAGKGCADLFHDPNSVGNCRSYDQGSFGHEFVSHQHAVRRAPGGSAISKSRFRPPPKPSKPFAWSLDSGPSGIIGVDAVELIGPVEQRLGCRARARAAKRRPRMARLRAARTPTHTLLRSELPMPEWSESWLSYTPYDAVALSATDLRTLSPAAFSALWSYVECGGNVLVFGGTTVPEPWRSFAKTNFEQGELRHIGLGRCFAFDSDQISALSASNIKRITEAVDMSGPLLASVAEPGHRQPARFRSSKITRCRCAGTVFIMLLFVIAIGPVNLIVLSRMNRRTWLLWTIPAISFLTCLHGFRLQFHARRRHAGHAHFRHHAAGPGQSPRGVGRSDGVLLPADAEPGICFSVRTPRPRRWWRRGITGAERAAKWIGRRPSISAAAG